MITYLLDRAWPGMVSMSRGPMAALFSALPPTSTRFWRWSYYPELVLGSYPTPYLPAARAGIALTIKSGVMVAGRAVAFPPDQLAQRRRPWGSSRWLARRYRRWDASHSAQGRK